MDTLETYLASDYRSEMQEIEVIDRTLSGVATTFSEIFDGGQWPYEFNTKINKIISPKFSQGTQAMVLTATGRMLGHCSLQNGTFTGLEGGDTNKIEKNWGTLQNNWVLGLEGLVKNLVQESKVVSKTFGANNPLTLSHISELHCSLNQTRYANEKSNLDANVKDAKEKLKLHLDRDALEKMLSPRRGVKYYTNAFVPLRALRAAQDFKLSSIPRTKHRNFFESTLHDHLSFSSIPDSRFDPAELLFCLEGLLLCAPESVDASLFDRVLDVLADKQNSSAHWRPNKPFLADPTGGITLPVSVEGANSLMRSTAIMDDNLSYGTSTARSLPLVQRFWHWLRARSVRFEHGEKSCIGWHSEHVNSANLIHIWDTSQVAEFMISFRVMLERHIATKSLQLSRLHVKYKTPTKLDEADETGLKRWNAVVDSYEPALEVDPKEQVYSQIGSDFFEGWTAGRPIKFSMLLYGPPGTGKSTVAENLADALNMPLITVTVSDFLGSGGANVEAHAKAIFQTLEAQKKCVILFDEIDSFLLDRESKLYHDQDSLFQFLTPGMLTKINDLRKRERSIFIIATNYADRIDPAIKRTGRIDKQYLLPLPDAERRLKIMKKLGLKGISDKDESDLIKHSVLLGYSDIKGVIVDAVGRVATLENVKKIFKNTVPATSLDSYCGKLCSKKDFPKEEFKGLLKLVEDAGRGDMIDNMIKKHKDKKSLLVDLGFSDLFKR